MDDKLISINEQLDELLMRQLELMQDYISVTVECETHQKSGFIHLAKTRYIQGSSAVSRTCLFGEASEEDRDPLLTVTREKTETSALSDSDDDSKVSSISSITYEAAKLQINCDAKLENQLNRQFGPLSSGSLKSAKGEFRKCLEKSMERASILEESSAIRKRYSSLMKEKQEIMRSIAAP